MVKKILLGLALLGTTGTLRANTVWLVAKSDHLELAYGAETTLPYAPAKVTEFKAWDDHGKPVFVQRGKSTALFTLVPNKQAALISVAFDDGYGIQDGTAGWKSIALDPTRTSTGYTHRLNFHKSLYAWSKNGDEPIGQTLEIIPLQDPFKTKLGKKLPIQVMFDGKPLANVRVGFGLRSPNAPSVKADKHGKAKIPVTPVPEQFISVYYDAPLPAADGSHVTYIASLRYELK